MKKMREIKNVRTWMRSWSVCAVCATLAMTVAQPNVVAQDDPTVQAAQGETFDITVQDTDINKVLQMLAVQAQRNIIASKSVTGTVSANLFGVTFQQALESVLKPNGYTYYEEGNFVYVVTQQEYAEMIERSRTRESRVFVLDYLSAQDANEFILPLLSDVGQSSARGDVPIGFKPDVSDGGADTYAYSAKVVVNDYPENLDAIAEKIEELDTAPEQVLVESVIVQTTLDESNAFGVDISVISDMDFTDLVNPLSAVNNLINGSDPTDGFQPADNEAFGGVSSPGNTTGPGTFKIGLVTEDVSVFLKLLDEVTDSTVLARPKVMCLNRQRAEVLVGARVGYLSTTATETTTTQTVEFLDTGIQLIFRPFISKSGMIRLEMAPSVSEASLRTVTDSNGLLVTIPDELTNELTTNVRIRDGETLVLGGLFREATRVTRRQVPVLGDVPLIGPAFRGQDDNVDRSEIIFLITPSVVEDETLWELGRDTLSASDEVMVGGRNGLLPFSRERITGDYNRDARDAFESGDAELALYHINNSLRINPNQPELIRFREQITGVQEHYHERSIMEGVYNRIFGREAWGGGSAMMNRRTSAATPVSGSGLGAFADADFDDEFSPLTSHASDHSDAGQGIDFPFVNFDTRVVSNASD